MAKLLRNLGKTILSNHQILKMLAKILLKKTLKANKNIQIILFLQQKLKIILTRMNYQSIVGMIIGNNPTSYIKNCWWASVKKTTKSFLNYSIKRLIYYLSMLTTNHSIIGHQYIMQQCMEIILLCSYYYQHLRFV